MPVIPAFKRMRQEDLRLEVILGYILKPCLRKIKQKKGFIIG
jgi:hypothetical protein